MLPSWVSQPSTPTAQQGRPALAPQNRYITPARTYARQKFYFQADETVALTPGSAGSRPQARGNPSSPRTPFRHPPSAPPAGLAAAVIPPEWASRRSVLIILRGLPPYTTPLHIFENFSQHGNITFIELDEERNNYPRVARFRFEPPPKDVSFFHFGSCHLLIEGQHVRVPIEFAKQPPEDGTFTTPLGNPCPSVTELHPPKLRFGVLTQPTNFMEMKSVESLGPKLRLRMSVDFKRKRIVIEFPVRFREKTESQWALERCYRVDIKFGAIKEIHKVQLPGKRCSLVITLEDPPLIWKQRANVNSTFQDDRFWTESEVWQRAVYITHSFQKLDTAPVSLDDDSQVIDLGRWMTYWIDVDPATISLWTNIETNLRDWNIKINPGAFSEPQPGRRAELWAMLNDELPAKAGTWGQDLALLGDSHPHTSLRFDVRYQLEVCISHGIINEYNITREFIEKLIELSSPKRLDSNRARLVLEYAADQKKRIYQPMDLFENDAAMTYYPTTMIIPDYCALMRKVTITPTRIYFNTPTVETTNRVIRHFKHIKDNFIRLQFTDELMEGRINGCEADRDDQVYTRAFQVLNNGIRMGQWHWKFLAFGNSQIRENGVFFFCESEADSPGAAVTCAKIMKWMGEFSHIRIVAKYAARIGQCFSTTRLVPGISAPSIVKIPDVERGKYCFTDGAGKISLLLAQMVARDWQLDEAPSAYQFRMGGCKGVLVSWPDVKGTEVHIRKSQEKFYAEFNGLEVIRCSHFSTATLNRQTITILSCLGVPDYVFVDMMADQVFSYNEAMTNKSKALELLEQFVDENQITLTIAQMVLNGFMDSREPFVQTLLQLWRSWSIKSLKEKARLSVKKGAFVLGCVDETGTLQGHSKEIEGQREIDIKNLPQIFLQVPDVNDCGIYKVITGLCIVGRNPSLHPGDIRVVNAVDVPALRHIRDVVVFPLTGDRDIPSMCSGGDLDGDDFFVIWDDRLIPPEWCHPPMDYTPPKPVHEPKGPTEQSLKAFFVLYMKQNNLPLIAHAHLGMADYEAEGAKHDKCKRLAELHSMAVDFVKTGVPAEWSKKLEPRRWPHFMEKARKNTYRSTKALGQLYDMVKRETFDSKENYKLPFDKRILNKFNLSSEILKKARQVKTKYDIAIRRVMGQLEINTEFEVWSTFVLSRPRVGTSYKLQEKVGRESAALKQQFRDICVKESGGSRDFDSFAPFVAAMYRVTWEEMRIALHEARQPYVRPDNTVGRRRITARSMPLISFPWLFESVLGRIATGGDPTTKFNYSNLGHVGGKAMRPHHKHAVSILDEQTEEQAMEISRTNDGQVIHRGEILHLFRHEEDEDGDGDDELDLDDHDDDDDVDKEKEEEEEDGEEGEFTGDWSLDSRMSLPTSPVGGGGGFSTPKMRPATGAQVDEEIEELISFHTPSPKKKTVVRAVEVDLGVSDIAGLSLEGGSEENLLDDLGVDNSAGLMDGSKENLLGDPLLIDQQPEEITPSFVTKELQDDIFPAPISPSRVQQSMTTDSGLGSGLDTLSEPEGGYDEVVLEVEEESALERAARLGV